ncbi:hypothetical protein HUU59_09605 [bacterium]|nr:hypothetical protein [bacterium]
MILVLSLFVLVSSLAAQTNVVAEAESLFHAGDYERVELLALRSANSLDLSESDRVTLELLGGYSLIMLEREEDARTHFQRALDLDSTLTLDPVQVSPKFRVVFDDVKSEWQLQRSLRVPKIRTVETTESRRARTESHIMNLFAPGAGFLSEREHLRGAVHLIAQTALTALWLSELKQNNDARKKYLDADSSSQAVDLYREYDDHHRRMWAFGLAAAGVYLASQLDLTLWRASKTPVTVSASANSLNLHYKF